MTISCQQAKGLRAVGLSTILALTLSFPVALHAQKGPSIEREELGVDEPENVPVPPAIFSPILPIEGPNVVLPRMPGTEDDPAAFGALFAYDYPLDWPLHTLRNLATNPEHAASHGPWVADQVLPEVLIDYYAPNGVLRRHIAAVAEQGELGVPIGTRLPIPLARFEIVGLEGFFDHHYQALLDLRERVVTANIGEAEGFRGQVDSYQALTQSIGELLAASSLVFFPERQDIVLDRVAIINDVLSRRFFGSAAETPEPLEIAIIPHGGEITAEQLHRLELEVSGAMDGEAYILRIEGRHNLFPEGDWGTADVRLISPLEDLGCRQAEGLGTLNCSPDSEGSAQFFIDVPDSPLLHWQAVSTTDESRMAEGSLPVLQPVAAAAPQTEPEERPQVAFISPITQQTGVTDTGDELVNRYPYGESEFVTQGDRWRYLLLIGRDLPLQPGDTVLSGEDTIRYFFEESHETASGRAFNGSHLERGLSLYAEPGESSIEVLNRLRDANMDMLVVFADLQQGVLPGPKNFRLNGQSIPWSLSFADSAAALSFVRQSPQGKDSFERVDESFGGEQLFVQLDIAPAQMPYGEIPITLTTEDGETGTTQEIEFFLRPAGQGRWRSSALDVNFEGGGQPIVLEESDGAFSKLHVRLEASFAAQSMPFGFGQRAEVAIAPTPEETPWLNDLRTAAGCTGYRFEDYAPEDLAFLEAAYEGGDPFLNVIVLNGFERISQELRHGHLAGTLMLRRTFLSAASSEADRLRGLLNDRSLMVAQISSWRRAFGRIDVDGPLSPLFKIEVPTEPLPGETSFGRLLEFGHGYAVALGREGLSDIQILDWYVTLGQQVVRQMIDGIDATSRELRNTDSCDALALIKFAYGTEAIAEMAVPTMLRSTTQGLWEPDVAARRWVRSTVGVARAYHEQVLASESDTDAATLAVAVLTFPLIALESGAIAAVTTLVDIADVSSNVVGTVQRYAASQAELAQAFGMSSVTGDARYREALRRQVSAPAAALQIGFGVIMVGFDGYQIGSALRASQGERLLQQLDAAPQLRITPGGLEDLAVLRDRLLQQRALDGRLTPNNQANLDRLLDGEFLDGALIGHRQAPRPGAPAGPAPDRPARIAPSESQLARAGRHGTSPDGIPRVMVLENDAPTLGVLDALDGTNQRALEALDQDLATIGNRLPEGEIESFVAAQTRQILRDPDTLVGTVANLGDIGSGKFNNALNLHYLIQLDPSAFSGIRAHGIQWETLAILAHEAAHRVQSRLQQLSGITIGRAMREFDASLVMVAAQNASSRALGRGQRIAPRQALAFAFEYALSVQTGAWRTGGLGSRFGSGINYFDGLFQLNWSEAVARARAYLPGVSERVVLEEFIRAQRQSAAANVSILTSSPLAAQQGVVNRWRTLISEAEARLASLPP